jgi:hypothetical protein
LSLRSYASEPAGRTKQQCDKRRVTKTSSKFHLESASQYRVSRITPDREKRA